MWSAKKFLLGGLALGGVVAAGYVAYRYYTNRITSSSDVEQEDVKVVEEDAKVVEEETGKKQLFSENQEAVKENEPTQKFSGQFNEEVVANVLDFRKKIQNAAMVEPSKYVPLIARLKCSTMSNATFDETAKRTVAYSSQPLESLESMEKVQSEEEDKSISDGSLSEFEKTCAVVREDMKTEDKETHEPEERDVAVEPVMAGRTEGSVKSADYQTEEEKNLGHVSSTASENMKTCEVLREDMKIGDLETHEPEKKYEQVESVIAEKEGPALKPADYQAVRAEGPVQQFLPIPRPRCLAHVKTIEELEMTFEALAAFLFTQNRSAEELKAAEMELGWVWRVAVGFKSRLPQNVPLLATEDCNNEVRPQESSDGMQTVD